MSKGFIGCALAIGASTVILAVSLYSAPVAAQQVVWTAYTYNPVATIVPAKGFREICEKIEKESDGRIKINFHLGGSLQIKADNITAAVSDNDVQIADDAFFAGSVPIAGLVRLPMLIRNEDELAKARKIVDPYVEAGYKTLGVTMLGSYYYPRLTIWSSQKLTSLQDIRNQKIRAPSPEYADFLRRFHATTVTLDVPQVPSALERGIVDGVVTSSTLGGLTWKDLLKYNFRLGISYATSNIIVNAKAFAELPVELQQIVRKVTAEVTPRISEDLTQEEVKDTQKLAAGGIVVTEASAADIATAENEMTSYWPQWAQQRGETTVKVLGEVRSALNR